MQFEVKFNLEVPEIEAEASVGPDDGSDRWYEDALLSIAEKITNDPIGFIDKYSDGNIVIY